MNIAVLLISVVVHCAISDDNNISRAFEKFGYSPECVTNALYSCKRNVSTAIQTNDDEPNPELENLMSEIKCNQVSRLGNSANFYADLLELKDSVQKLKRVARKLEKKSTAEDSTTNKKNCAQLQASGDKTSGVRTIYPFDDIENKPVSVFCDQLTDGGGWTVFQNRDSEKVRENFYRPWKYYAKGFGDLNGEFWLGLDTIHALVFPDTTELRVDLEDYESERRYAKYGSFYIGDEFTHYKLLIGNYSGDAGDSLTYHNQMKFTTLDLDNDITNTRNCGETRRGGWWYGACADSNLNGYQHVGNNSNEGIIWNSFNGGKYSYKKTSMKVRPSSP